MYYSILYVTCNLLFLILTMVLFLKYKASKFKKIVQGGHIVKRQREAWVSWVLLQFTAIPNTLPPLHRWMEPQTERRVQGLNAKR